MANDKLYIEGGQGSGSDWTQGWSFVDERGLFADSFEGGTPLCELGQVYVSEAHTSGTPEDYIEIHNTGNTCSMAGFTLDDELPFADYTFGETVIEAGGYWFDYEDNMSFGSGLSSGGDFVYLGDPAGNVLAVELMPSYDADNAAYGQSFDGPGEINGDAITGCYATPTPGEANADCAPSGCGDETAGNYNPDAINIDNALCEYATGCTNPTALNYDMEASIDDGSCQFLIQVVVDMSTQGSNGASISVDGGNSVAMNYANFNAYSLELTSGIGDISVSFTAADGEQETIAPRVISISETTSQSVYTFCFNSDSQCPGCTNPAFTEFNPYAMSDNAACATAPVLGCTYVDAENYSASANVDDGSCTGFGSANDCPADLNGDQAIGAGDLLIFLGQFGQNCE